MPIKKKLPESTLEPIAPRPKAKKGAPKAAKARVAAPQRGTSTFHRLTYNDEMWVLAKSRIKSMGPAPEPAELPGADGSCASLAGQTWKILHHGKSPWTTTTHFFEDGTVNHQQCPGFWKQQGAAFVLEVNGRFAEFIGRIEGDTASGDGKNADGVQWKWTAQRQV